MNNSMWVKFERCAILVMFVVTLALSATLLHGEWSSRSRETGGRPTNAKRPNLVRGDTLALWADSGPTGVAGTVLFLSSACKYCVENGPFYGQLSLTHRRSSGRLVAVFSSLDTNAEAFLQAHHIRVDKLMRLDGARVPVSGVPTMVTVRADGTVQQIWKGALRQTDHAKVLSSVLANTH